MRRGGALDRLLDLFSDEEDPREPVYDPAHLGAVVITTLTALGCIYWLLWTLLVYEGGLGSKVRAAAVVLFTAKTLRDVGYEGSPYAMGAFEGWLGNLAALALCLVVVAALHRLYGEAARRHRGRKP